MFTSRPVELAAAAAPRTLLVCTLLALGSTSPILIVACTPDVAGTPLAGGGKGTKTKEDDPTVPATRTQPPSGGPTPLPTPTPADGGLGKDAAGVDAGAADATPPPGASCGDKNGADCRSCCFAATPGGPAIDQRLQAIFEDCLTFYGCGPDPDCQSYCSDMAVTQACADAQDKCSAIDTCIAQSKCFN